MGLEAIYWTFPAFVAPIHACVLRMDRFIFKGVGMVWGDGVGGCCWKIWSVQDSRLLFSLKNKVDHFSSQKAVHDTELIKHISPLL